ncbi:MAG: GNAT family N-acetyltransferase [Oscillospiraceae bacterium]|nr:GNAT family N-acetyltransferase [Oscillospiraceae bacterium]
MYLLQKDFYAKVRPMFEKMLDYETTIRWVFGDIDAPCQTYVDGLTNPETCFIEMIWGFCYFKGKYNEQFINSCLDSILGFHAIFADNKLLNEIENNFLTNRNYKRGTRRSYILNVEKFLRNKFSFIELPGNYELILKPEEVILMYNGKRAGHCNGAYNETLTEINIDVFLEEEHRNKGIGSLVCAKLIDYHLSQNHDEITWGCDGHNFPSIRCAEKLGFDLICENEMIIIQ